jgi:hypothetical protein
MCVDDGRDGVGSVVKAVDEFEAERDEQGDGEQKIGPRREKVGSGEVACKLRTGIRQAADEGDAENDHPGPAGRLVHLLVEKGAWVFRNGRQFDYTGEWNTGSCEHADAAPF